MRFITQLAWLAVVLNLIVLTVTQCARLSGPPLPSVEERVYGYHNGEPVSRLGKSKSIDSTDQPGDEGDTQEQETSAKIKYVKDLQDYIRDARDLNAQEGMWRAANFLAVLTAVQLLFGGFTLWFVLKTLHATRDTLRETRNATTAANRTADAAERAEGAFVDIELSTNPEKFSGKHLRDSPKMTICATICNYGKTPARNLKYKITPVTKGNQPIFCDGTVGMFPSTGKKPRKIYLKDLTSVDIKFDCAGWLMNNGTDFIVEWEYQTIFSKVTRSCRYIANFQADMVGAVDHTINTTHQDYAPRFDRIDESESVRLKEEAGS